MARSPSRVVVQPFVLSTLGGLLLACGGKAIGESADLANAALDAGTSMGTVAAEVDLPPGVVVSNASYTFRTQAGVERTATLNFPASGIVTFSVDAIAAPTNGTLEVTMVEADGAACAASAAFSVVSGAETNVDLGAQCVGTQAPVTSPTSATAANSPAPSLAPSPATEAGAVDVVVTVPAGITVSELSIVLTGPGGLLAQDLLAVSSVPVQFAYDNLPVANGDSLMVKAISTDGIQICTAMSAFDVLSQKTTATTLSLACQPSPDTARDL